MTSKMDRRKFLQSTAACATGLLLAGRVRQSTASSKPENPSRINGYSEAPSLALQVAAGAIPRVDQRLPDNPLVLTPIDGVKNYGGYIRTVTSEWAGGYMEETRIWPFTPALD